MSLAYARNACARQATVTPLTLVSLKGTARKSRRASASLPTPSPRRPAALAVPLTSRKLGGRSTTSLLRCHDRLRSTPALGTSLCTRSPQRHDASLTLSAPIDQTVSRSWSTRRLTSPRLVVHSEANCREPRAKLKRILFTWHQSVSPLPTLTRDRDFGRTSGASRTTRMHIARHARHRPPMGGC